MKCSSQGKKQEAQEEEQEKETRTTIQLARASRYCSLILLFQSGFAAPTIVHLVRVWRLSRRIPLSRQTMKTEIGRESNLARKMRTFTIPTSPCDLTLNSSGSRCIMVICAF